VILGFSGSGSERIAAVPFVALFIAVDVGAWVVLIVEAKTLGEMVLDSRVELKLNSVEAPEGLTLGEGVDDPGSELVVEVL
jgi:hypothetical protein